MSSTSMKRGCSHQISTLSKPFGKLRSDLVPYQATHTHTHTHIHIHTHIHTRTRTHTHNAHAHAHVKLSWQQVSMVRKQTEFKLFYSLRGEARERQLAARARAHQHSTLVRMMRARQHTRKHAPRTAVCRPHLQWSARRARVYF